VSWLTPSFGLFFAVWCLVLFGAFCNMPQPSWKRVVYVLGMLLFFGGLLNFIVFWHVSVAIGGDAAAGKFAGGKYFVASHGRLTEVSEATWRYSLAHARSIWITHPLGALGLILMYVASRKPATADASDPANTSRGPLIP